ncbi:MAG: response regulator [Planctomycetaceae bacterium]
MQLSVDERTTDDRVTILLVDDRPEQLLVLETMLADLRQNLVRANSGREALRFLLHDECALILLDVNMPELDGFETALLIRERPSTRRTPIIFVTAHDETETHVSRGYSLGAVDYIHTPVLPEVLVAKVSVFVELARQTERLRRQADHLESCVQERTAELQSLNTALQAEIAERTRAAEERDRLLSEAQDGVRRRDEFLAMLSHELRNPLASITSAADVMRIRGVAAPETEAARDIIERQAQHMARLLNDLLDISRITRGTVSLQKQPVDVGRAVAEAVEAIRDQSADTRHEFSLAVPEEPLLVHADPTRLTQIISNLLGNAVRYSDPGGRIAITADRENGQARIRIRDSGIGIAPEMISRIFDPFVQLDRSHARSNQGLGVGLTLVRRLVELHGGRVAAHSAGVGQGSEFIVLVPEMPTESATETPTQPIPCDRAADRAAARRIVLVDDNGNIRRMLSSLLGLNGHQVEVSTDGPGGVETIRRLRPDVALIDIGLPGFDGYEVAAQVRADRECRHVRLVAMTGYGQPEDRRRALAAGFDDHLVKPFSAEALNRLLAAETTAT